MLGGRNGNGQELLTTSGVCVRLPDGHQYITAAVHGFSEDVWHPTSRGRRIGRIVKRWLASDIALIQLEPDVKYARTTFVDEGDEPHPFTRIINPKIEMRHWDLVHMNTPFNGTCSGHLMGVLCEALPADEPNSIHQFSHGKFIWFGQKADRILDACCGAVVFNDDHEVLGQFRFLNTEGDTAYFPTFDPLIQDGYTLSEIS
ncbi:MAG: serine palmitoyltransferase component [Watsoniomyces obsoletus]|nr:MAG: serine palmitoyltransferase component [Watsoniomyces obsoletus]